LSFQPGVLNVLNYQCIVELSLRLC